MRAAVATLGLLLQAAASLAEEPIESRNGRAFSLAFLRIAPRTSVLESGRAWSTRLLIANDVRRASSSAGRVLEDYEVARLELSFRRPLAGGWDGEATLAVQSIGGGFLDPLIDFWHDNVLHWSRREREGAPHYRSIIESPGNPAFGSAAGLADLRLQFNRGIGRSVLSVAVELPTGDAKRLLGSGGIDFGLGLSGELYAKGRWQVSASANAIWQGPSSVLTGVRRFVDLEVVCVSYRFRDESVGIVQYMTEASALRLYVPASDAAHRLILFGWRRTFSNGDRLELYFSEDRDLFEGQIRALADVGPDFSIGVNWMRRG